MTLSKRGAEVSSRPSLRDRVGDILGDSYDPDTNPSGFYAMAPELVDFINEKAQFGIEDVTYGEGPWGTKRLCNAMANFISKTFDVLEPIDPKHLLFANGITGICDMIGNCIADEGDGVLFSRPIYQSFKDDFAIRDRVESVFVSFGNVDQFSPAAAAKYEEALIEAQKGGTRIRGLMLCNPHNPLGKCYQKETIIELMKLCDKYKIHLISDEIYASSVYEVPDKDAVDFTSVLALDYSKFISPDYLHVLYGMSKDFAGGGLRLGCFWSRSKDLMRAMSSLTQFHSPANPTQKIAAIMLEDENWLSDFQTRGRRRLAQWNRLVKQILDDAGINYYRGNNAGLFIWIDLRNHLPPNYKHEANWEGEATVSRNLMRNKVYITPGHELSAEEPGWFRIIFSQEERTLKEGLDRILKTIGKKS